MTAKASDFRGPVEGALAALGFPDDFARGEIELRAEGAEVWLRIESVGTTGRGHQIRGAQAAVGLVARSRIYTFRHPPRPGVLEKIQGAGRQLPSGIRVEHRPDTGGLYLRRDWASPPGSQSLADDLQDLAARSLAWLDEVLPNLFG